MDGQRLGKGKRGEKGGVRRQKMGEETRDIGRGRKREKKSEGGREKEKMKRERERAREICKCGAPD